MVPTIKAEDIHLFDLKKKFGLERAEDPQFFSEWQEELPDISDSEKQALDEVKADYLHLSRYTIQEAIAAAGGTIAVIEASGILSPALLPSGGERSENYISG